MSDQTSAAAAPTPDRLAIFASLWAITALFYQYTQTGWITETYGFGWGISAFAALTIVFPHRLRFFMAMMTCSVIVLLIRMPYHPNHILFEGMVNVTLLIGLAWASRRHRGVTDRAERRERMFADVAPLLRLELLLLYFFVVLHKLNWDFIDPEVSCGAHLYEGMFWIAQYLPKDRWAMYMAAYGTLGAEAAIPLLLLFRPTRFFGVIVGLGFHTMLALHPHGGIFSFSSMMFTLYYPFLAPSFTDGLREVGRSVAPKLGPIGRGNGPLITRAVLAAGAFVVPFILLLWRGHNAVFKIGFASIFLWAAFVTVVVFLVWRRGKAMGEPDRPFYATPLAALYVMPLLVLFNGFNPYLGLKTQTSFAMFSNLRTEAHRSNHLFMPQIYLTSWQTDIVRVVDYDENFRLLAQGYDHFDRTPLNELLWEMICNGELDLPYYELRRMIASSAGDEWEGYIERAKWREREALRQTGGDFKVTFTLRGETVTVERRDGVITPADHAILNEQHPLLLYKLVRFRPFDIEGRAQKCRH